MKAIILCGGTGTRLRPITHTRAKQLLPVANKPIVFYGIESIVRSGIREIGIIIGETGEEVKEKVGDGNRWGIDITYLQQDQPLGLAHAVKIARDFLQDDAFVMYLGDNLIKHEVSELVSQFDSQSLDALIQLKEVGDPRNFGVAELDEEGNIIRLEEKPPEPRSNLALVGVYLFNSKIHDAVDSIEPSARGELEITDAIQKLLESKAHIGSNILTDWWLDTGKKDDMLEANRIVLDELPDAQEIASDSQIGESSRITGRVKIESGTKIENCIVRGPVVIGSNCTLQDTYVGPYTSLGDGVEIVGSEIEHSIVMDNGRILNLAERVGDSLIGHNAEVTRVESMPASYRFMLGDDSKVDII
jgi:glucose-1-phosphate thymidylyltransferase